MSSTPAKPQGRVRAAALCAWAAYLVVPVEGWGFFPGRPLGLLATTALAVTCWSAFARRTALPWLAIVAALALKITLGMTAIVPRGFSARYYANASFSGPAERGTEPADSSFSRTDHRLRFGVEGEPDVPLAFFNDEIRFNYYRDGDPDRKALPFSVAWQGYWRVTSAAPETLYLLSQGGAAELSVGSALSVRVAAGERWTGVVTLPPGYYRVNITWSVPQGGARQFDAGRVVGGRDQPFDEQVMLRRRAPALALAADRVVRSLARIVDAGLIVWLLSQLAIGINGAYRRLPAGFDPHATLTLAWLFGIADALVAAMPMLGRMITLSGGDDWLSYETRARDIGLHGLWMNAGSLLGHGEPFFQQPLYPYFLAACHWVFGDDLFGVCLVQRLFVIATVIVLWRTAVLLFDEPAGLAVLVTAVAVVYEKFSPWSNVLLTEVLFVPLVCLWIYTLVRFAVAPSRPRAVAAGVVGGLATLVRSSLLLGWAGVFPALAVAMGWHRRRLGWLAILMTTMILVTSTATIRNWVVAHRFVIVSSEGPVVLFVGNPPPPMTIAADRKAQYERLGLDPRVQAVVEYARQQPRAFGHGLWLKAQYTLGWFDAMRPQAGTSWFYVVTWSAALIGLACLRWITPSCPAVVVLIPLIVALAHFAVVVLFQPHVYGDRILMPFYMLIVPYAAIPVIAAARLALGFGRERAAATCWIALAVLLIARLVGLPGGVDVDVLCVAVLLAGLCVAGVPALSGRRVVICAAYTIALAIWLVRAPEVPRGPVCRPEWLFVALVLFSQALLPSRTVQRTAASLLLGCAALASAWLSLQSSVSAAIHAVLTSVRPAFADVALCAAIVGLCAGAAALAPSPPRLRRVFAYAAGVALAIGALGKAGTFVNPDRALLAGRIAAFSVAGAAAYALVWLEGAWPGGDSIAALAMQGAIAGAFIASLFGVELASGQAEALFIAGLAFGAARRQPAPPEPIT
jgi:dolichyl-phosphate-mannose-protein mannosyltransferase